ncbi:MAG: LexA family transcriptional regulator [Crocinitomicaceae bacterium]|nr:LexA family transcriptional regulator [Crocinitomicaceae bacterium]
MGFFAQNLRLLRRSHGVTQAQLAEALQLNRPALGAYEEGRAEPKIEVLKAIAAYFLVTIDELLKEDDTVPVSPLRVLPIVIDENTQTERIPLVPVRAAAGYLNGYGDTEFIEQLEIFHLPFSEMSHDRTHRLFQIEGDSMLPVPSGAYIITDYVMDWETLREGQCYVVVSITEGIVFKRFYKSPDRGTLRLVSDNEFYEPFDLPFSDVREVWRAKGFVSFDLNHQEYLMSAENRKRQQE